MEIHLIRHTKPDIEAGICYGQSDIQLATSFDKEWTEIRKKLPLNVDRLFTSPLSRCTKLSERLAAHFGLLPEKDVRLMEMNFGDWEMKKWDDIDQSELNAWMNDFQIKPCPNGESYSNVTSRLKDFISDKLQEESKYLIVTHGGIIKCFHGLLNNYHGMDLPISYGEIYSFTGNWQKLVSMART
jgi:alpha-ribazole phosphatase